MSRYCSIYTVVLLSVATLYKIHSSNMPPNILCYYYECIEFSFSPKAPSLMQTQFLGKEGGLIREGLLCSYLHVFIHTYQGKTLQN